MKKKCGHQVGYKCCCNLNYTAEHSFDLVDEINHKRITRDKDELYLKGED